MEIKINKKVNFERIICVINLYKEENREDIKWLLKNYKNDKFFSIGETNNFSSILNKVYGLINKNHTLTSDGNEFLEGRKGVMIPETGVYELVLYHDFINDQLLIIDFNNHSSDDKEIKKANSTSKFQKYLSIENIEFKSWKDDFSFKIEFIKDKNNEEPYVIKKSDRVGNFSLISKLNGLDQKLIIKLGDLEYVDNIKILNVERNLIDLIENWDPDKGGLSCTFDELIDKIPHFTDKLNFQDKSIIFNDHVKDDDLYDIQLVNVPVVPTDKLNANKIIKYMIVEKVKGMKKYFSIDYIKNNIAPDLIKNTLIEKYYFNEIENIDDQKLLDEIKNKNPLIHAKINAFMDVQLR